MIRHLLAIALIVSTPFLIVGQVMDNVQRKVFKNNGITVVTAGINMIDTVAVELKNRREVYTLNTEGYCTNYRAYDKIGQLLVQEYSTYKYDSILTDVRYIGYSSKNQTTTDTHYQYDKKGRLKQMKIRIGNRLATEIRTWYNKDGTIKKRKQKIHGDPKMKSYNGKVSWSYVYENGELEETIKKEKSKYRTSAQIYETTISDNQLQQSDYVTDLQTDSKILTESRYFDSNKRLIKRVIYMSDVVTINGVRYEENEIRARQFQYDGDGFLKEEILLKNEKPLYSKTYLYD